MSVKLMATVFMADIEDLAYKKDNEDRKAKASTVKLMLLAYADHANDDGEASYPGYTLLERKTALSRQGVSDTLEAIRQNGYMACVGVSRRGTNDYKLNIPLLESLVKPLDYQKEQGVKPLDQQESSHLTGTGQATGLNPSITTPNHPMGAEAPARSTGKKGDVLDGMLYFGKLAADPANALKSRVAEFPADVQATIQALAEIYNWPAAAIPGKPRGNGKGGQYAQWINEARKVNEIIGSLGREALEATKTPCKSLSVSHPGAILWCLAGEVGKLAAYKQTEAAARERPAQPENYTRPPAALREQAMKKLEAINGNRTPA